MRFSTVLMTTAIIASAGASQAQDSALVLGKSTFGARCSSCHGDDGKGGGDIGGLFEIPPADLTKLAERAGGAFPFSKVYQILAVGLEGRGHGIQAMPVWGEYFLADALKDRGIGSEDAKFIVQGRILSLTYYLESIQE